MKFQEGIVLYENAEQFEEILESFPREACKVINFSTPYKMLINENGKEVKGNLHTYMWGDILSIPHELPSQGYTVSIKEKSICYSHGIKPSLDLTGVFYVTKSIIVLHRNGTITRGTVTDFSKRNNCLESQGAMTSGVHVLSHTNQPFYLVSFYTTECNVLRIERLTKESTKYVCNPNGQQYLFTSLSGKEWYITPPKDCINRFSYRVIRIVDAEGLLQDKSAVYIDLLSKTKRNSNILYIP